MSMIRWWREYVIVVLLAAIAGGYWLWPENLGVPVQEVKVKTEEQTKQTVKTVVTRPDGTVEEKVVTTEKDTKVSSSSADKKSRYSIGAYVNTADRGDYRMDVGARLGDLPAFGVVGYEFNDKTVYAGLQWEF